MSEIVQYIEKQTVRKIIEGWKPNEDDYDTRYDYLATFDLWDGCCCAITAAPAADVAPVVHGHWGDEISVREHDDVNGGYFITRVVPCSNCGYEIAARNKTKFCPECGAKMDEEVK